MRLDLRLVYSAFVTECMHQLADDLLVIVSSFFSPLSAMLATFLPFLQPGDHARLLFLSVSSSFPFRTFSLINLIQHVKNRSIHLSVSVSLQWLQLIGLLIQVKYTVLKACTQSLPYQLSCGKQCFVCVCV